MDWHTGQASAGTDTRIRLTRSFLINLARAVVYSATVGIITDLIVLTEIHARNVAAILPQLLSGLRQRPNASSQGGGVLVTPGGLEPSTN